MALAASASGGCEAIRSGSAITSAGRTRRAPATSLGVRWKGVSSAPESVVGIAAQTPPRAPAIALAVSITRPPPSATSGRPAAAGNSAAEISSTRPGGTSSTSSAVSADAGHGRQRPLGREQHGAVEAALLEQRGGLVAHPRAEADQTLAVDEGERSRRQGVGAFVASRSSTRSAADTALSSAFEIARR